MAELIAGIVEGIAALIELLIHALAFLAKGSITLISFGLSADYRARKASEWQNRPARIVLALGYSGLCLITLCGLGIWFGVALFNSKRPAAARQHPAAGSNYLSLSWRSTNSSGLSQTKQVVIAEDGIKKILAASNRNDLLTRLKSSMIVVGSTNAAGTNLSPGRAVELKFGRTVTEN